MMTSKPPHAYSLLTDLYQLTMAQGYWAAGKADVEAVFHLYIRRGPFGAAGAIVAGVGAAADLVENFGLDDGDKEYLRSLCGADGGPLFQPEFLDWLVNVAPCIDIDAIPEGEFVFPNQPILRVSGPLAICQILETALLNLVNFHTLIATKAARVRIAAGDDTVLEMGLRRAQGQDGAMAASYAAYVGGVDATSNVLAGRKFGIPIRGTHAHSWVMAFDTEPAAFQAYAEQMPNNCVFLVDTYNTVEGIRNAITTAGELATQGHKLLGIRLDSGDLCELSKTARTMLDQAGLEDTAIVASSDLDEHRITELKAAGAKITVWGIGTRLVTGHDQPALGGVYKLGSIRRTGGTWRDVAKHSEDAIKASLAGHLDGVRQYDEQGSPVADLITDPRGAEPALGRGAVNQRSILRLLIRGGQRQNTDDLQEARRLAAVSREFFAAELMENETDYPVTTALPDCP